MAITMRQGCFTLSFPLNPQRLQVPVGDRKFLRITYDGTSILSLCKFGTQSSRFDRRLWTELILSVRWLDFGRESVSKTVVPVIQLPVPIAWLRFDAVGTGTRAL